MKKGWSSGENVQVTAHKLVFDLIKNEHIGFILRKKEHSQYG